MAVVFAFVSLVITAVIGMDAPSVLSGPNFVTHRPTTTAAAEPPTVPLLLAYSLRLLPVTLPTNENTSAYDAEIAYRTELAAACVAATSDRTERYICVKLARFESNYREDVGRCKVIGKANDKSAWQIVPRSEAEDKRLCQSLEEDARFHVERVRESRSACRHLPKEEQLALYARGNCTSEEGKRLSRVRFPTDAEVKRLELEGW